MKTPEALLGPVSQIFLTGGFFYYYYFNDKSRTLLNNDYCEQNSKTREKQCLKTFSKPNSTKAAMACNSWLEFNATILKTANTSNSTLLFHRHADRKEIAKKEVS